jgi:sulfur-carrier protein adenylyltransferase/sulfurtransferase
MMETYARQMCLPEVGIEGQKKLNASSVLVIGVGGLGCAALPYLAASGIQRIGMVDFDRVEASNLARQTLFGPQDIGRSKVEVAQERLSALYPAVQFQPKVGQLTHQNARDFLAEYDLILDGTDNIQTRFAINDACAFLRKPWVYGSIFQWEGQVSLFLPGNPDYRSLFPEGTVEPPFFNCSSSGVLGPFVGLIGMIQALETIKWLAGIEDNLAGKILIIDGKTWRFSLANLSPPVPSDEISYSQLKKWMIEESIQFIDIREPHEKQNGDLGGVHLIPGSLTKNQKIVLYCQTGKRSLALMRQLRKEGYETYSLQGGVNGNLKPLPNPLVFKK